MELIPRTSELARVFGIDFHSVITRGSQYRVESMLLRLCKSQGFTVTAPPTHDGQTLTRTPTPSHPAPDAYAHADLGPDPRPTY